MSGLFSALLPFILSMVIRFIAQMFLGGTTTA
jgi:hypothetical protein